MKTTLLLLATALAVGCNVGPRADATDPTLDLLGDVVRSVRLAEIELEIWHDEVEPLRAALAASPQARALFAAPRPAAADVRAIRDRVELLVSAIPRHADEELLPLLALELDRANDAIAAFRGPRNRILAGAEALASRPR